ncbi:MAG TPA: dethiobiotin synthase [Streptosporangiaceae bacterium]
MKILIITGTDTGVGKTVTTAAVAARARDAGRRVAVVKPAQTGEPLAGEPQAGGPQAGGIAGTGGDLATVGALTGIGDLHELVRYPDPLSPEAAARSAGLTPLDLRSAASYIAGLADDRDQVIVEGAGGLLVRYDPAGATIADLAGMLDAPVVVVAAAGLGTLNHTALTLEALAARKVACAGVVIGSWPARPGPAELANLTDLETVAGQPLAGVLPEGAGQLARDAFGLMAARSLAPALGGTFRPARFAAQQTIADL